MADYATLLRDHVTLKCRSLDRIFLQAYVPKLQPVVLCASSCAGNGRLRFHHQLPLGRSGMLMSKPSTSLPKSKNLSPTWTGGFSTSFPRLILTVFPPLRLDEQV